MSRNERRRQLLCYDIADPRRLQRIHRRVKRTGIALQYSLFECHMRDADLQKLVADLRQLMDVRHDDIRIYGPRSDAPPIWIGAPVHGEGIQLFNNPEDAERHLRRLLKPPLQAERKSV